jgi:hypothetical protein
VLLGILTAAGLLSIALAAISRRWRALAMPAETVLLTGMGFALLLGTIATSDVNMRYVLPSVPFLALGGTRTLVSAFELIRGLIRGEPQRP